MNYNFLFKNNSLNYNDNIELYELLNKISKEEDILNDIKIKSDAFLELILPYEELLEKIFKYDSLYIYNIIDYFKNNQDVIDKKKNYIKELLNENNLTLLNYFLEDSIDDSSEYEKKNIYKDIILNKQFYFSVLFNNIWLNNLKSFVISNNNLTLMAKQILIVYYHNEFYSKNKIDQTMFDNDTYLDFLKLIVKYKHVYIDINNEDVILKKIDKLYISEESGNNMLRIFFNFCLDNKYINKNLLSWFFVLFYKDIPKYLYNDFYYIIIGINHNVLGIISKILNYIGIDFYKYDKNKFDELVKNIVDNNDYLSKIYENLKFDNSIDLTDITNNIYLIKKMYEIQQDIYIFLSDIELNKLNMNQYYIFILTSPLDNAWNTNIYITNNYITFTPDLINIYNSVESRNFTGNCTFITNENIVRIKNIEKNLYNNNILFDKYINFLNVIAYLSNFEILPFNKSIILSDYSLQKIIDQYLKLFPKEKHILNNYGY